MIGMHEHEGVESERPKRDMCDRSGQHPVPGPGEKADTRHALAQCREQSELHEQKPASHRSTQKMTPPSQIQASQGQARYCSTAKEPALTSVRYANNGKARGASL